MKTRYLIPFVTFMTACAASASAGELNVTGDLNVASNLTANSVTLGGETRTNWPSGGGVVGGAVDLTTAVVNFSQTGSLFRLTLTNHTAWVFTNHVAGREVNLQLTQDATGGWTNAWPSDLLWPGGQKVSGSTAPNHFNVFKVLDNGERWLVMDTGIDYSVPCVSNCSYALQFDGGNYVSVAQDDAFETAPFTIEYWIKSDGESSDFGRNFGVQGQWNDNGWRMEANEQYPVFGGSEVMTRPSSLNDGNWHHVAMTLDESGNCVVWHDGQNVGSASSISFTSSDEPVWIGAVPWFGGISGSTVIMDEVRFSNVVRYTSSFTPATSFTVDSDTVAYWKFNEGSGSTLADETSNHDGTLEGSPEPTWVEGR